MPVLHLERQKLEVCEYRVGSSDIHITGDVVIARLRANGHLVGDHLVDVMEAVPGNMELGLICLLINVFRQLQACMGMM